MPVVPRNAQDLLVFCQSHVPVFSTNASSIGLTSAQAAAFAAATTAAQSKYDEAVAADNAKRAAVAASSAQVAALRRLAGETVNIIRAYAQNSSDPAVVYEKAQIPAPAPAAPIGPPGTPMDFTVELLQSGALKLRWKCANPPGSQGTIYEVRRRLGMSGSPVFIGASGTRTFEDASLPAGGGGGMVTYEIRAVRSTVAGNPAQFNVNFGIGAGGGAFAVIVPDGAAGAGMKMAA